jgi:hypothetical protein
MASRPASRRRRRLATLPRPLPCLVYQPLPRNQPIISHPDRMRAPPLIQPKLRLSIILHTKPLRRPLRPLALPRNRSHHRHLHLFDQAPYRQPVPQAPCQPFRLHHTLSSILSLGSLLKCSRCSSTILHQPPPLPPLRTQTPPGRIRQILLAIGTCTRCS